MKKIVIDKEAFDLLRRESMNGNFDPSIYKKLDEDRYEIEVSEEVLRIMDRYSGKYSIETYSALIKKWALMKKVTDDHGFN